MEENANQHRDLNGVILLVDNMITHEHRRFNQGLSCTYSLTDLLNLRLEMEKERRLQEMEDKQILLQTTSNSGCDCKE